MTHLRRWNGIKDDRYATVYGETGRQQLARWEAAHGPVVTDQDVQQFNRAHRDKNIWRGLEIHGGGTKYDWTEGCVALDRKDIRWLYDHLKRGPHGGVGTPLAVVRFCRVGPCSRAPDA
ncbi:MAG: L,D-transpeptidase [bacterium]|nr:L,D-transpeptidase [bacterium]